jgi:hypothetical protein
MESVSGDDARSFPTKRPARLTFGVDEVAYGAALELESLALRKGGRP